MNSNKELSISNAIFRISFNLSLNYIKYIKVVLQSQGLNRSKIKELLINNYFYNLNNDLKELEELADELSEKQQDIITHCRKVINNKNDILKEINLDEEEISVDEEEPIFDDKLVKERLELVRKTLLKLIPQFNIDDFTSNIKRLLSQKQLFYTKKSATDAGLSTIEFNNYILTSLIPDLNKAIFQVRNRKELTKDQIKNVEGLTNYITYLKEGILKANQKQSINNMPSDPIPVQNKADTNVRGNLVTKEKNIFRN